MSAEEGAADAGRAPHVAVHVYGCGRAAHGAQHAHGAYALLDDGELEDEHHKEGEEGEVPVLVQAPEQDGEHLGRGVGG